MDAIFYETSALNNINVDEVFISIAKSLYKNISERSAEVDHKKPSK
jgi:GTPase SAR1 family protein